MSSRAAAISRESASVDSEGTRHSFESGALSR